MGSDHTNIEAESALDTIYDIATSEIEKLNAAKIYLKFQPRDIQAVFLASTTAVRSLAKAEGYRLGLADGQASNTRIEVHVGNKVNIDNRDATIASGAGAGATKNTGQQLGMSIGSGQVSVSNSSLGATNPGDRFNAAAFEQEITKALHAMMDRIEQLEAADAGVATEALAGLKKFGFPRAETIADAQIMLEDLWDESMRKRYSPLRSLFSKDGALADVAQAIPTLLSMLLKLLPSK